MSQRTSPGPNPAELLSDEDVYEAMKKIPGYLDISAGDFKELYLLAYEHAETRLYNSLRVAEIMTREVITVLPATPLAEAAARMAKHHITGLPWCTRMAPWPASSRAGFFRNMGDGSQTPAWRYRRQPASGGCPVCMRGGPRRNHDHPVITV
jgi:hypothetical protein